VTAAALAYVQVPLLQTAAEIQTIVNASVTGDLGPWGFKSPWADDSVQMAFGFEARRDEVHDTVDTRVRLRSSLRSAGRLRSDEAVPQPGQRRPHTSGRRISAGA